MRINAKYGFGMAPISTRMQGRYDYAILSVQAYLHGNATLSELDEAAISELKGMVNRCIRQDQWDWLSVHSKFGHPDKKRMNSAVNALTLLRRFALANDDSRTSEAKLLLRNAEFERMIEGFIHDVDNFERQDGSGWVYILSTREQAKILKIGMTTRSVFERVKEINSATGVLVPFSARDVFRVPDTRKAEREIFHLLSACRVRPDREFFELDFREAQRLILSYLDPQPVDVGNEANADGPASAENQVE